MYYQDLLEIKGLIKKKKLNYGCSYEKMAMGCAGVFNDTDN
jgi:hypothetical protein